MNAHTQSPLLIQCSRIIALLLFAGGVAVAVADPWPQWRGPDRNGISEETGLATQWPENGPPLHWQIEGIGEGYSTPSVVEDRIYLLSNEGLDNEFVLTLSVADGSKVWSKGLGKVGNPDQQPNYPAARSTPTVENEVLYALGSNGDLACMNRANGEIRWQRNLRSDFGGEAGKWAYAESPLIDGEQLICTPGGGEATLIALNKKTGEPIWKSAVPGGDAAAYSSAIIVEAAEKKQYVQFLNDGLVGVDAGTGAFLWRYARTAQRSPANIPTPVADNGYIYNSTGRGGGALIHLKKNNGNIMPEEVYYSPKLPTAIGGAVLVDGHLYGTSGEALLCVEFTTGNLKWEARTIGPASLCYADGHLYLHGEEGEVALVEVSTQEYREKGRFSPPDLPDRPNRGKAWAYPVIANGRLYIRDGDRLWCYDIRNLGAGK